MHRFIVHILTLFIGSSCLSDLGKEYETKTSKNFGYTGSLAFNSLVVLSNALNTSGTTGITSLPTTLTYALKNDFGIFTDTTNCYEITEGSAQAGAPRRNGGSHDGTAEYTFHKAYCQLVQPSNGPDHLMGAVARVKGFLCALGSEIIEDEKSYTTSITVTESCFPKGFVTMLEEEGLTNLDLTHTSYSYVPSTFGNTNYAKALRIQITNVGIDFRILYTMGENSISAALWYYGQLGSVLAINMDTTTGYTRYEGRFYESSQEVRHIRAVAKGSVSIDGTYSSLEDLQMIHWETYGSSGGGKFQTVSGNATDGYKVWFKEAGASSDPYIRTNYTARTDDGCFLGTCTGNNGIPLDDDGDMAFITSPDTDQNGSTSAETWFLNTSPLTFTTLTTEGTQN
jgi:hypothetical protein